MKKPINKWSIGIALVAVVYLLADIIDIAKTGTYAPLLDIAWFIALTHLFSLAQLIGLAVLIELVDQIRWDAKRP